MLRKAVVAGSFYAGERNQLLMDLNELWPKPLPARKSVIGAMVPHAGYIYSGRTAAQVYARMEPAATYVFLGPNHTGQGWPVAISAAESWETPLGTVPVDSQLAGIILQHCAKAQADDQAHRQEHSLEVQLPFLQKNSVPFSIVCIALRTLDSEVLKLVGESIAVALSAHPQRTVIIASSDMNHFENLDRTRRLDQMALERVEAMDPEGLIRTVRKEGITMCGAGPAAAMLFATRQLGATKAERVAYATSAEASGDEDRVVGYAGVLVY